MPALSSLPLAITRHFYLQREEFRQMLDTARASQHGPSLFIALRTFKTMPLVARTLQTVLEHKIPPRKHR